MPGEEDCGREGREEEEKGDWNGKMKRGRVKIEE